ncbi:MAG: DNA-3-methyladenine glycosylase I [Candidatus Hodarchaeales archaeon]|jgi:DNA-3-methyladenine glycosylase I
MKKVNRCGWARNDQLLVDYHDKEWGVPVHDDQQLFEMLILEGAQAGLSWTTVLKKRNGYRRAYEGFEVKKMALYTDEDLERLRNDPGIIRNRLKIKAAKINAQNYLLVQEEHGSFDTYIWDFVGGKTIKNEFRTLSEIPTTTPISDDMSKALKKRGFKFVGSTICYAFMQSVGMVNDHTTDCFRYEEV